MVVDMKKQIKIKIKKIIKFIAVHLVSVALLPLGAFADTDAQSAIIPDNNTMRGSNVGMDKAANGLPVVNINNPNGAGVSHNQFVDFNIGNQGVILNNSTQMGNSELGGVVLANPNLKSSANTIINEVTSNRRSNISGATEIFGQKADYILANPNGISVNGAAFININNATFTTGVPSLNNLGELEKLTVGKGDIEFLGKGANATGLDYFEIISRTAKLNAKIHEARNAKIVTGKNEYNVKTKTVSKKLDSKDIKPTLAIDSSMVGGIYAGRISIISTEDGVGVNVGDMGSSYGDIEITADGTIEHRGIRSAGNISVESVNGGIKARKGEIILKDNSKKEVPDVAAAQSIKYRASKDIHVVKNIVMSNAHAALKLEASGKILNEGSITSWSAKDFEIKAATFENKGKIIAKQGMLAINTRDSIINHDTLTAEGDIDFRSNGGAGNIFNLGTINSSKQVTLNASGNVTNQQGEIRSAKDLTIHALQGFVNGGLVHSGKKSYITAANITNQQGQIFSIGDMHLKADQKLENSAIIHSDQKNYIVASQLINRGNLTSDQESIVNVAYNFHNTNTGHVNAKSVFLDVTQGGLQNDGIIASEDVMKIDTFGTILNKGDITSVNSINISTQANVLNHGKIAAIKGLVKGSVIGDFENQGTIESARGATIASSGGDVINRGMNAKIVSKGNIILNARGDVQNIQGHLESNQHILLRSGGHVVNDSGKIKVNGVILDSIALSSVGNIIDIYTGGNFANIGAGGDIAGYYLAQEVGGDFNNESKITALRDMKSLVTGAVQNSGMVAVEGKTYMSAASLSNSGEWKSSGQIRLANGKVEAISSEIVLDVVGDIKNTGEVKAIGDINVESTIGNIRNKGGIIISDEGSTTLNAIVGSVNNIGGTIFSAQALEIKAGGKITNDKKGHIISYATADLSATQDIINLGLSL